MKDKNFLIIDDDSELCEELAEIISSEGYPVETATDGARGAALIKENSYSIVILDFKMPNLTAIDILKEAKARGCSTKFFLITGRPFIENLLEEEGLSGLVEAVMSKPFDCKTLLNKITESLK